MTDGSCPACGAALEPGARFCASCGAPVGGIAVPTDGPRPAPSPAPVMVVPPVYMRPPRNPRQMASTAVAVMVLVSGMFALVFGNMILYWDAWDTDWDWQRDREVTVINTGAFFAGVAFVSSFAVAMVSAYCAIRLVRYQLAVAGPVALLVAYFSVFAYETFMLVISVHILILSVVSLALLYYAIPIYAGRKVGEPGIRFLGPLVPPRE